MAATAARARAVGETVGLDVCGEPDGEDGAGRLTGELRSGDGAPVLVRTLTAELHDTVAEQARPATVAARTREAVPMISHRRAHGRAP